MLRFLCALGVSVAASASPSAQTVHPAHADAPAAPVAVVATPLAPAPPADVPAVLRPPARVGGHHAGGHHAPGPQAAASHGSAAPAGLAETLDAYLALHDALASDRLDGISASAQALAAAFRPMTEAAPADDPHFWHIRSTETAAVLANAEALADAATLSDARVAFGRLSAPFAAIVNAVGVPEGYDLATYRCGMAADVPEGGVWLQRSGDTRNPYFGSAMPSCGTHAESHGAHDHAHPMRTGTIAPSAGDHACAMRDSGAEQACCAGVDSCEEGAACCDGEMAGHHQMAGHGDLRHRPTSCCGPTGSGGSACSMGPHAHTPSEDQGR